MTEGGQVSNSGRKAEAGVVDVTAAWICAGWTAIWLVLSLSVIFTSWSTLEQLQAGAAGTITTISTPNASSSGPSVSNVPTASSSATAPASSPAAGSSSSSTGSGTAATAPVGPVQAEIPILGKHQRGSFDLGMILLALAFGALGATAHCLYVFLGAIAGSRPGFNAYRIGWFFPQPPLGAIFGVLLYVTIRAGLLSSSSGVSPINMFGVASIAAVGGLSAPLAYKRLTSAASASGTTSPPSTPTISRVSISSINAADRTGGKIVTVTGTNLDKASFLINGVAAQPSSVTATKATFEGTALPSSGVAVISLVPNVGPSVSVNVVP